MSDEDGLPREAFPSIPPTEASDSDGRGDNQLVGLWAIAFVSAVIAIGLTVWSGVIEESNAADTAQKAGLAVWATYLLVLTAIALVGALVLTGVRGFLRRAGLF